jgi:hypothetical protein
MQCNDTANAVKEVMNTNKELLVRVEHMNVKLDKHINDSFLHRKT